MAAKARCALSPLGPAEVAGGEVGGAGLTWAA